MGLCQGLSQHCCDPRITSLTFPPRLGTPQPILSGDIPGAVLNLRRAGGQTPAWERSQAPGQILGSGQGSGLCWCPDTLACVSLSAPEPTVEEKLQKLHSEIKFALKVDNPVSADGAAWPGTPLLVLAWL